MTLCERMAPDLQTLLARLEEDTRRPHSVWGQALDLVADAVVVLGTDRRILYYSEGASELTGFGPEEVLGSICTEGLKCLDCVGRCRLFEEGRVCHRQVEIETRDGRSVSVLKKGRLLRDADGGIVCGVETLHDVSDVDACRLELTRLAEQLEVERNLLEAFAETVSDGVATIDATGRIGGLSRRAADLLGRAPNDLRGQRLLDLIEDDGVLADTLPLLLSEGGRVDLNGVRPRSPQRRDELLSLRLVGLHAESGRLVGGAVALRPEPSPRASAFHGIVGRTAPMRRLAGLVEALAKGDATVLLGGETGTGKEMVARALHLAGPRASRPFVAVSCAAPDEGVLEAELFGREPRSPPFGPQVGRLESVGDGTLFLDEVGCLPPSIQARLLRVLEEREFARVGGTRALPLRARIVASTNDDLHACVERGEFREDLYYRLRVVPLLVPPLRERLEDVPLLAAHFASALLGLEEGTPEEVFTAEALDALARYAWPGNVRELKNAVHYAVATGGGLRLDAADLPPEIRAVAPTGGRGVGERRRIEEALQLARYNRVRAAELLGISRTTLWRKMRRFGLA